MQLVSESVFLLEVGEVIPKSRNQESEAKLPAKVQNLQVKHHLSDSHLDIFVTLMMSPVHSTYLLLSHSLTCLMSVQAKQVGRAKSQAARPRPNQRSLLSSWTASLPPATACDAAAFERAFNQLLPLIELRDSSDFAFRDWLTRKHLIQSQHILG